MAYNLAATAFERFARAETVKTYRSEKIPNFTSAEAACLLPTVPTLQHLEVLDVHSSLFDIASPSAHQIRMKVLALPNLFLPNNLWE